MHLVRARGGIKRSLDVSLSVVAMDHARVRRGPGL